MLNKIFAEIPLYCVLKIVNIKYLWYIYKKKSFNISWICESEFEILIIISYIKIRFLFNFHPFYCKNVIFTSSFLSKRTQSDSKRTFRFCSGIPTWLFTQYRFSKLDEKFKWKMDENFLIGHLSDLNNEENILG